MFTSLHPQDSGVSNRNFIADDLDHIEVLINTSSVSDIQSICSNHKLTTDEPTFSLSTKELNRRGSDGYESIELNSNTDLPQLYCKHARASIIPTSYRGSTPTDMVRRWSQNICRFSRDKRTFREHALSRLPSRKIFELDCKLDSNQIDHIDNEIEQLVSEIKQHESLMENSAFGEDNRLQILCALPQPLYKKRIIKNLLSLTVERESYSKCKQKYTKRLHNGFIYIFRNIWRISYKLIRHIRIWRKDVDTIEGNFGSNVSSYFKFLRWLFFLNIVLLVCTLAFIIVPQIVYNSKYTELPIASNLNETDVGIETEMSGVKNPPALSNNWKLLDLLTADDSLNTSLLFYGSYTNETFFLNNSRYEFNLPQAYYMTILILYLSTFMGISFSMAQSYRKSFVLAIRRIRTLHAEKILCSWDYSIKNRKAADLKYFTIYTELKEWLVEIKDSRIGQSMISRIRNMFVRIIIHVAILIVITGFATTIYMLLELYDRMGYTSLIYTLVAMLINFAILLCQFLFSWISRKENFRSPRYALHVTLVRNFILELVTVSVLIHFWLSKKYEKCWETCIGQEIYRFIITDFIINTILMPIVWLIHVKIPRYYWPFIGRPKLDIAQLSAGLIFNQTLLWLGLLFAPLLAAIMVLKMFITFYINKFMLFYVFRKPRHAWRSTRAQTLYLLFTFLSLLGVILILGYIMTQIPLSRDCGPFRDYSFMFHILIDGVLKLRQHRTMWLIVMTLIRPAVVGGMLVILTIMVYYTWAKFKSRSILVNTLKGMLIMEAKDKKYLLAAIANITKIRENSGLYEHKSNKVSTGFWSRDSDHYNNSHDHCNIINNSSHSETSASENSSSILRIRNV